MGNFVLMMGLLQNKGASISFRNLLYWNIIDYVYPKLRDKLKETPEDLFTLQKHINNFYELQRSEEGWDVPQDFLKTVPEPLKDYFQKSVNIV